MRQICGKWLKYVWKWLNYLRNALKMWKMTLGNGQNISEIAQIHGARIKYMRNGFSMLGMALEFDNGLKYVGNDECMWKMA